MKYSLKFRIWHWLNTAVVFTLLKRIFLSWRDNSELVTDKLFVVDIGITELQAKAIQVGTWK